MLTATKNLVSKYIGIPLFAILATVLVFSCASGPKGPPAADPDVFQGQGQSDSLLRAMNLAKMDAVRKLVVQEIGAAAEQSNRAKLDQLLYNTNNPNQFVLNDTLVTDRKDNVGSQQSPQYLYELTIKVNRKAVLAVLQSNGIGAGGGQSASGQQGGAGQQQGNQANSGQQNQGNQGNATQQLQPTAEDAFQATEAQKSFIRRYVDKLTYLVYYNEKSGLDPVLAKGAVGQANSFMLSKGYTAIDIDQVEKLKKDKALVYEEQTGGEISLIQWIAQSLNADVYIEIDGSVAGSINGKNYYGQASITLKLYETSTGQLLGSQPYNSPQAMSTASLNAAQNNALQSSVFATLPLAIDQSKIQMAKQFANGIKYELILQNAGDARLVSNFRQRLRRVANVADVATRNQSADQATFDIYYYGRLDDLVDGVWSLADVVPGLENLDLVLTRGKSVTFDTGL